MAMSRRSLLGAGLGAGAGLPFLHACAQEAAVSAQPAAKAGIQLYTLRGPIAEDLPGVLARLAEIGYSEVEGYGDLDTPVPELKQMLSDNGLVMPSAHVGRERIRDNPAPEVERAAAMGYEYAVLNWLAPEERDTLDKYRAWADTANRFAEQCRAVGVKFCWHNHDFEFTTIDGVVPNDILLERCDAELVEFQLDLYWAARAGVDLMAHLDAHGARTPMVHVKDMAADGAMADVGAGTLDFAGIFAAHQFKHYYAERDDATAPFETAAASYTALAALLR
jgi:sugar phosphate isomerase/epimerase